MTIQGADPKPGRVKVFFVAMMRDTVKHLTASQAAIPLQVQMNRWASSGWPFLTSFFIDPISIQTRRVAQPFFGRQRSIVAMLEWQRMWIIFWSNSNDAERAEYAEGRRNCRRWDWLDDLGLAFMTRKLIRLVAPAVE